MRRTPSCLGSEQRTNQGEKEMKPMTKHKAKRLCKGLDFALAQVKTGECRGLCRGLSDAEAHGVISIPERYYLNAWITLMLKNNEWLEDYMRIPNGSGVRYSVLRRYNRRKLWVEWMKKHLMETSE